MLLALLSAFLPVINSMLQAVLVPLLQGLILQTSQPTEVKNVEPESKDLQQYLQRQIERFKNTP